MNFTTKAMVLGLLGCTTALPAVAETLKYTFSIIEDTGFSNGGSGEAFDYSINNLGVAARNTTVAGSSFPRTNPSSFIETVDLDGDRDRTFLNQDGRAFAFESAIINDAGQVLTTRNRGPGGDATNFVDELVRVEANGSITVLGQVGTGPLADHPNQFLEIRPFGKSMNNNGEVVALTTSSPGYQQIVKFAQDGQSFEVLADEEFGLAEFQGLSLSLSEGLDINDKGQVAFGASTFDPQTGRSGDSGVFVVDETGLNLAFRPSGRMSLGSAISINNDGDILMTDNALGNGQTGSGVILHKAGSADTDFDVIDVQQSIRSQFAAPNLNNFGQAAYIEGGAVVIDGQRIVGGGDILEDLIIGKPDGLPSPVARATIRADVNFNDLGQAIIDIRAQDSQRTLLRADPVGATVDNAIQPDDIIDGVSKVSFDLVNALGVDSRAPIFVDPVFGDGLSYSITNGGPNFTSIVVPIQDLGGLDMFDVVFGNFTQAVGFGDTLDFTTFVPGGISSFDIFGKDGMSSFDGDFIAGFTFANQGTVELDIAPASQPVSTVPLPASIWMLMIGLGGAFGFLRRTASST